ncbi:four-carbon acid sugar kinase family protein [Alkalihalobacillus sp. 1P02AB]|uniref:four-carbon acid sugar kinase family protein n=1 Tax=Alkalihalobacillus sp. 1P02AB TaxID=3132260 RepID=UPI0039A5D97E
MNLAIIADDLTGANDSGVQLAKYGLQTSVFFKMDAENITENEAVVFDTDSRAKKGKEAKESVEKVTRFLLEHQITNIYKKIDSTMRGSIGHELIGFHNQLQTDFIFIAAGYPKNGRKVINGYHYLNGRLLSETEIANDPVTPVKESHIPTLLKKQMGEEVGLINLEVLRSEDAGVFARELSKLKEQKVTFVVIDSESEEDLQLLLKKVKGIKDSIGWVGSAGLANYLPAFYNLKQKPQKYQIVNIKKPVLTVVGSVNVNSRNQLTRLLEEDVFAIEMKSYKAVSDSETRTEEVSRVYQEVISAAKLGKDVVIYSAGEQEDIAYAREIGAKNGFDFTATSREIVTMIGEVASRLLKQDLFQGIVMTGGDTAKKICDKWNVAGFKLYDELEVGVPISSFIGIDHLFAITKAGGFGKEEVFIDAIRKLKGVNDIEQ